jgi:hypothetical protein
MIAVQHTVLEQIADPTTSMFAPGVARETRSPMPTRQSHAPAAAELALEAAVPTNEELAIEADTVPISERFCGAMGLSSLFAFGSAPLLAHAAAVDSPVMVFMGLSSVAAAAVIQLSERRRAIARLTQVVLARGLEREVARQRARAILKLWLS